MPKPPIFPLPNTTYFPVSFRHYAPRVSPTGGAVFTPPQAAPSAAMFSLPNDGFPSLLSRYFSALQSGAPVTAGHRWSAGRLSPFRQFLLSPPLFSVIPSFFCRIYVFILHSLYKENAGTNRRLISYFSSLYCRLVRGIRSRAAASTIFQLLAFMAAKISFFS